MQQINTAPIAAFPAISLPMKVSTMTLVGLLLLGVPTIARANDDSGPQLELELGGGGKVAPTFEGSGNYVLSPYPIVRLKYLSFRNGKSIGGAPTDGFSFSPSFRYLGARKAVDDPVLFGLPDRDASIELGAGITYTAGPFSVFATMRYGVSGHHALVGEFGVDYAFYPAEHVTLSLGPRATWASGDYMDYYFSVSPAAAALSRFPVYDAGGGFKSLGAEALLRYEFADVWALEAGARYDRLVGDAANSPIVAAGSQDQLTFRLGVMRTFRIDF